MPSAETGGHHKPPAERGESTGRPPGAVSGLGGELRARKSRRIAWALAGVVALLYALAFLINH